MEELKPCPFCGNMPQPDPVGVQCIGVSCPIQYESMTIEEWNTRNSVMEDSDYSLIDELLEERERLVLLIESYSLGDCPTGLTQYAKRYRDATPQVLPECPYGWCPICGAPGKSRERRPNGNDRCEKGHVYPSASAAQVLQEQSNE